MIRKHLLFMLVVVHLNFTVENFTTEYLRKSHFENRFPKKL